MLPSRACSMVRRRDDPADRLLLIVTELGGLVPMDGGLCQFEMVRKKLAR